MRFVVLRLVPHPDTPCRAVERIEARIERMPGGRLQLAYILHGNVDGVRIPAPRAPVFADHLWEHTCFEAFVAGAGNRYEEYNFAPSGEFAAYAFTGYRAGMRAIEEAPQVDVLRQPGLLRLEARLPSAAPARLGLAAVVEAADGALSYWALRHPPGRPDFHHADAFALDLDEIRH